jgi:hypothetical protein
MFKIGDVFTPNPHCKWFSDMRNHEKYKIKIISMKSVYFIDVEVINSYNNGWAYVGTVLRKTEQELNDRFIKVREEPEEEML